MKIKRKRNGTIIRRPNYSPSIIRMIRQAQSIAMLQANLMEANERLEVLSMVIEKLERQIHEEPRW